MAGDMYMPRNQLDFGVPKPNMFTSYQQGPIHKSPAIVMEDIVRDPVEHRQNQLQFNLDAPSDPSNLATRYLKPGPITIEKLTTPQSRKAAGPRFSPMQFSVISEDKLSLAMKLAKRDIKRKLLSQGFTIAQHPETEIPKKTKVTYSKEYKQKLKQRKERENFKSTEPRIEERYRKGDVKSSETQTSRPKVKGRHLTSSKGQEKASEGTVLVHMKHRENIDIPSPSRDADSPATKQAKEIRRLRKELRYYIERIEQLSKTEKSGQERKAKSEILRMGEEDPRKEARETEQASRSARLLYALQQQVRDIQGELEKAGPGGASSSKKSQTLTRLAAAHRGAVRALQMFIHHMPDEPDSKTGLPKVYHELATLIKQLSMVCAQLEIGESGIPDMVLRLPNAKQQHELFSKQLRSPPRKKEPIVMSKPAQSKQTSRRKLLSDFQDSEFERKPVIEPWDDERQWMSDKTRDTKKTSVFDSPDRESALRAGIVSLLRAADESERTAPPLRSRSRTAYPKHVTYRTQQPSRTSRPIPLFPTKPEKTSVLLPSKLKHQREKVAKITVPEIDNPRFADATVASSKKEREPIIKETVRTPDGKPVWSPPGSPSAKRRLAKGAGEMSLLGDLEMSPRLPSPRRAWVESDIRRPVHRLGGDTKLTAAEAVVLSKLQPLLDQAEDIANKYQELQRSTQQSLRYKLSERSSESAATNAELLSELLLEDILLDTAKEFQRVEHEKEMERKVLEIQEAPTVESLLQRLERMETEEDIIRQRWRQVQYDDVDKPLLRTVRHQEPLSDIFADPEPIQITSSRHRDGVTIATDDEGLELESADRDEIVRIERGDLPKSNQLDFRRSDLEQSEAAKHRQKTAVVASINNTPDKAPIPVFVPSETMENIRDYRDKFEQHLKRTSTQAYGSFDPWKLVDDVADDIFEELVASVSQEVNGVVDTYVEDVYKAEFGQG
ncbi:protein moonraker-like isoform X2 [Ptychodera flava]|uniref:protein moonraker-like isoform X2 n=1 Tax=Ptychodera flava TaxID=63121 RepID=UPI003969C735